MKTKGNFIGNPVGWLTPDQKDDVKSFLALEGRDVLARGTRGEHGVVVAVKAEPNELRVKLDTGAWITPTSVFTAPRQVA